jgi:hypothetical protein
MARRLLDRLCFLLIGLTLSWIVFVVFSKIGIDPLYIGLFIVLPTTVCIAMVIMINVVRNSRAKKHEIKHMSLLTAEWDREDSDTV